MSAGIRLRDDAGNALLEITERMTQFLGSYNIAASQTSGSITVPTTGPNNQIWYYLLPNGRADAYTSSPEVTISGNTLSWQYLTAGTNVPFTLLYGRY